MKYQVNWFVSMLLSEFNHQGEGGGVEQELHGLVWLHLGVLQCQKSRKYTMDDDMCAKSGLQKTGGCACASTLGSAKMYSASLRVHPGR